IELAIVDRAFGEGWVRPRPPARPTGCTAAVIGSGPAGLAAAQQLTRAGHSVTVFERDDRIGGLLRYGIPDYKLEKWVIDRRIEQMSAEGTRFQTGADVGADLPVDQLRRRFGAIVVATGAQRQRELGLAGRELAGVEPAMEYLVQCNRRVAGLPVAGRRITAAGKHVVVLGAGDTSADCLGNALREGALSVTEIAHGPTPPSGRRPLATWPEWPFLLRTYGAHQEGGAREWQIETTELLSSGGRLTGLRGRRVEFPGYEGLGPRTPPRETGAEVTFTADLLLVAIGFAGVEDAPVHSHLGLEIGDRGTIVVDAELATDVPGVFAAGDCVRGADLIVTAIADGRRAAQRADSHLQALRREPSGAAAG
ncbi:MAG: glutamate synthase subunit beta, partial [Gaiellales bacterium]